MNRRDFLRDSIGAGLFATSASSLAAQNYDLVAIKNGEPDTMFDQGIQALGGMQRFVNKGQTVVVKPNIGWDAAPERAANTHPLLVKRVVEHCLQAGAKTVYVFDYTCDDWRLCYRNSGIEQAVKEAGGKIVPGNYEKYFHPVTVNGQRLKGTKEHELILESDVFINIPVLKHHRSATLTIAMKNLMGTIWDRRYWHKNNLHQCIADFGHYRQPDLNIVDAYNVMMRNGPRGISVEDVVQMKTQIIAPNMVAADAAAARVFGIDPEQVEYLTLAKNIGTTDLSQLAIKKIKL